MNEEEQEDGEAYILRLLAYPTIHLGIKPRVGGLVFLYVGETAGYRCQRDDEDLVDCGAGLYILMRKCTHSPFS